ncbi:MAG TPA: extracellular solute-binding protein [Candidatus Methylomirabilis sp.]|nr:extracellular solute-binding protein [Candidatus Methylomirabilis sp.]
MTESPITRRGFLAGAGGIVAASTLGVPAIAHSQAKEMVIGGAASHKAFMEPTVIPMFEKQHRCKIVFEGTKSLVNLEKMVSNKAKPYLSVVMMDDPVLILAVKEDVIEKLTQAKVPNMAKLKPSAIHMDGMWVNYLQPYAGIAYATAKLKAAPSSWADLWDPQYKSKLIVPSLQNTEGLAVLFMAAHLETGKPLKDAQFQTDAAFKKLRALKPNLLTVYTQMPQAFNLLEQGEALMIGGALSSYAMERKRKGAPIDMGAPKEGVMSMPSGIAKVKNGPEPELAYAFIDEMLGVEYQKILADAAAAVPTNTAAPMPAGMPKVEVFVPDWANVAEKRNAWVERWDKEMGA